MNLKSFILFILSCSLIACSQNNNPLSETEKQKISSEIIEMFNDYHEAIKTEGLVAEFDYLDDSSDFYWVPPGYNSALTIDSVKTILTQNSKFIKSIEFSFESIEIFPLKNTIANYSGIVKGTMIDTSNANTTFRIIESGTLIKRKAGWKLLSGQSRNLE
ncbi:hypothetical protein ACFS5M_05720 [Lacinutrix iliipiscaria]|uniref:SnoaL-like domain-containing protein n=1 Tax=Lacinutrix iliipiscaria TaxID=1230532 RepID=A0ABW5WKC7_9FLAO